MARQVIRTHTDIYNTAALASQRIKINVLNTIDSSPPRRRKLTCVNVSVLFHVTLLMKSFSAVLTRIGSSIRVNEEVS